MSKWSRVILEGSPLMMLMVHIRWNGNGSACTDVRRGDVRYDTPDELECLQMWRRVTAWDDHALVIPWTHDRLDAIQNVGLHQDRHRHR